MNYVQWIDLGRNVVVAVATAVGAYVALAGLSAWKKQKTWEEDNDLARRLLLALYRYRESLYAVRHPAMTNSEMDITAEEKKEIYAADVQAAGKINAYAKRWEKHGARQNELNALLLEADALWGADFRNLFEPIFALQRELYTYINIHISGNLRGNTDLAKDYREILRSKRDILYDMLNDEEDDYRRDFLAAIKPIESELRSLLGRRRK